MSYMEERRQRKLGLAAPLPTRKERKPLKRVSEKKMATDKAAKEARGSGKTDLQKWYEKIMQSETGKCWETGVKINKQDKKGWHGSIAHILGKAHFPSVATHPQNYMILDMWSGVHGKYDSSWERAATMKVWSFALKVIIKVLYPLLTPEEKRRLPDVILQEIDPLKTK